MKESSSKIERIKEIIDSQELTVEDVRRMEREKKRVEEQMASLNGALEGHQNALKEAEEKCSACFRLLENAIEEYNDKARDLELIPESGKHAEGKKFGVNLEKDRAEGAIAMMGGLDLNGFVEPHVEKLGEDYVREALGEKERITEVLDRIESINHSIEELSEDIEVNEDFS